MKKYLIIFMILMLFLISMYSDTINNKDNPIKGNWDFQLKKIWETEKAGETPLVSTTNIQVDKAGRVYLFNKKFYKFVVFDKKGEFLYSFGERGEGPGQYKMVFSFFLVEDTIIVTDKLKIHVFSTRGKHLQSYRTNSYLFPLTYINKQQYITFPYDPYKKNKYAELQVYDLKTTNQKIIAKILPETEISATDNKGMFSFSDKNFTTSILVSRYKDFLFLARSTKYSIKKLDLKGKELLSISIPGRKQKRFSLDIKKKRVNRVKRHGSALPNSMKNKLINNMPDNSPFFTDILVDDDGLLYVLLNNVFDKSTQEIDIFSSKGEYLYKSEIKFSEEFLFLNPPLIKGNFLYVFVENDEGDRKLVKYSIRRPPSSL